MPHPPLAADPSPRTERSTRRPPDGVTLRTMPVPADLGAPDAWLLHGQVDTVNAVHLDAWGTLDRSRTVNETLAMLRQQSYADKIRIVAVDDRLPGPAEDPARVVGHATLNLPRQGSTDLGRLGLGVRPSHRRRGIGSALHDTVLDVLRTHGRSRVATTSHQRSEPTGSEPAVAAGTGSGRVHADDPSVRFAQHRGWSLEQVARLSVVRWGARCPDRWVEQLAALRSRMATDAPTGGVTLQADVWDAARVRADEHVQAARGVEQLVTAVEHVPTGTLVAFTILTAPTHTPQYAHQSETLVLREHRGHRLGLLVKTVNLQRLAEVHPAVRRVGTWNAEENAPMLAINTTLGFRPAGGGATWQVHV
ncbi:GNAT family N-acetyltransferase [Cellulomonas soli]|uniref:GNAT family N-acetyltransferase n=1 Tax=Cellulomonas soli TaxID=931535 RepID=UPI0017C89817|nr:GNAT family N-acetyltransferase [Cellulomonas soli]NYI58957.1 GNAT superfamily N-acetyltransferase [Cellulomonas soli]